MKRVALVTGITGQDGAYLANFLLRKKYQVIGIASGVADKNLQRLKYFNIHDQVTLLAGDVADKNFIKKLLKKYHPQEFYNLAGQSSVAKSWLDPSGTFHSNACAVVAILESIQKYSPKTRFFQCSSAEIYGNSARVITENLRQFNPLNPYGVSKLAAHLAVENFRQQYGLYAVNGVLFNHESPLRQDFMVAKKIASGVAKIVKGAQKKIVLGDIKVYRDWGFAGEFVEAMWLVLQPPEPRDYVICSGISLPLTAFLKEAFGCVGIANWQSFVESDKKLFRKMEIKKMSGSPQKIKKELGWQQRTTLKQLAKMMVDYELKTLD